jgi:hypothetical protein
MYIVDHNNQSTGADELSLTAIAAELGRPKGADLTKFAQAHLDGIAADLNSRPRKRHNYATPEEVFDALLDKAANAEHAGNGSDVSIGT